MIGNLSSTSRNLYGYSLAGTSSTEATYPNVVFKGFKNRLRQGSTLTSANGEFIAMFKNGTFSIQVAADGAVLWQTGKPVDDPEAAAKTYAVLQDDGNLVLYGADGKVLGSSGTNGSGASQLVIFDNGTLALLRAPKDDSALVVWYVEGETGDIKKPQPPMEVNAQDLVGLGYPEELLHDAVTPAVETAQEGVVIIEPATASEGTMNSIQEVRADIHNKIKAAAKGLDMEQVANAVKAGWKAWGDKYCPEGKATADCPYPNTVPTAVKMIDEALAVGNLDAIVGTSNVDDGQFPVTAKSAESIDVFLNAVIPALNAAQANKMCAAKGEGWTYDAATNACVPPSKGSSWLPWAIGAAAVAFLLKG